jgi:hypothetical protein
MQTLPGRKTDRDMRVYLVLLGGVLYLALQMLLIKPGVFFSGDAGVKFLMVKQLEAGKSAVFFSNEKPAWVESIWKQGFFPLKSPFVYDTDDGKVFAFPPAFEWLTLPFYKLAGFRGLFILPAFSLFALWLAFSRLAKRCTKDRNLSLLALVVLILCSPLSAYGTMFWEHTLAAALSFAGCCFTARPPARHLSAFLYGTLAGIACFFRIEVFILNALFAIAALYHFSIQKSTVHPAFVGGLALPMLALIGWNVSAYGSPLGAQGLQFLAGSETDLLKPSILTIFTHLNLRLLQYFPIVITLPLIWYRILKGKVYQPSVYQITYIISCFLVIVPFFLPNAGGKQLGPRYLLPIVAPLLILAILAIKTPQKLPYYKVLLPVILAVSFVVNILMTSGKTYSDAENRILPLYESIAADPGEVVIVQNQYMTQELARLFEDKHFFVAETPEQYSRLYYLLKGAGVNRLMYASVTDDRPGLKRVGGYYFSSHSLQ